MIDQAPRDPQAEESGGAKIRRLPPRVWMSAAVVIVAILVLFAAFWRPAPPPRLPTYQEILDTGEDFDGLPDPDTFPQLDPGDTVRIRDRIVHISWDCPFCSTYYATIYFPYQGGKWRWFNDDGRAPAFVDDDVTAYVPGVSIELLGTVERFLNYEVLIWAVAGQTEPLPRPIVTLENATAPSGDYAVGVANVTRAVSTVHYGLLLQFEGFGVDTLRLGEGTMGTRMRFSDLGDIGIFDDGDRIDMPALDPGNYTLVVQYMWDVEVGRLSFFVP